MAAASPGLDTLHAQHSIDGATPTAGRSHCRWAWSTDDSDQRAISAGSSGAVQRASYVSKAVCVMQLLNHQNPHRQVIRYADGLRRQDGMTDPPFMPGRGGGMGLRLGL
jgi:hypothetical protein